MLDQLSIPSRHKFCPLIAIHDSRKKHSLVAAFAATADVIGTDKTYRPSLYMWSDKRANERERSNTIRLPHASHTATRQSYYLPAGFQNPVRLPHASQTTTTRQSYHLPVGTPQSSQSQTTTCQPEPRHTPCSQSPAYFQRRPHEKCGGGSRIFTLLIFQTCR